MKNLNERNPLGDKQGFVTEQKSRSKSSSEILCPRLRGSQVWPLSVPFATSVTNHDKSFQATRSPLK